MSHMTRRNVLPWIDVEKYLYYLLRNYLNLDKLLFLLFLLEYSSWFTDVIPRFNIYTG